jgi:hypothetical protein
MVMDNHPCKTYCCEYYHDGSWWGIDITAYDWADAEVRAKKMSLQLLGESGGKVSAVPGMGTIVKLLTWVRNL